MTKKYDLSALDYGEVDINLVKEEYHDLFVNHKLKINGKEINVKVDRIVYKKLMREYPSLKIDILNGEDAVTSSLGEIVSEFKSTDIIKSIAKIKYNLNLTEEDVDKALEESNLDNLIFGQYFFFEFMGLHSKDMRKSRKELVNDFLNKEEE